MLRIFLTLVASIILTSYCVAEGPHAFTPWTFDRSHENITDTTVPSRTSKPPSFMSHMAMGGIQFFIDTISRVDGDRCPMYPTCSAYSMEAVKKHGFIIGFVLTADRLIHESNEMDYAPPILVGKRYRYYDPLLRNDFWWSSCDTSPLDKR